jgi:hypothetical protein
MDLAWNAMDTTLPTSVEAKGDPFNPDATPVMMESHFEMPANSRRPPIRLSWYQGGAMPQSTKPYVDLNKIDHGAMFKGGKGYVVSDFGSRLVIPFGGKLHYDAAAGRFTDSEKANALLKNQYRKGWTIDG